MTSVDQGTAYGMAAPSPDLDLIAVEAGTPPGELLRRYWHPIALTDDANVTPRPVRVLGEDLILFRDGSGRPGLVHPRCCHRGTTLYYGKVEDRGIRCCYHGWLFDTEGNCLEMPCEADQGRYTERYRQPWYPVQDYVGFVFAYLGPPEKKPALPRYDIFEDVPDGFRVVADADNIGLEGDPTPCNWFQTHENVMDPFHVFVLHAGWSENQFVAEMADMPDVSWHFTELGVMSHQDRTLPGGDRFHRVTEVVMPNVRIVASPFVERYGPGESVAWTLPISRTETKIFSAVVIPEDDEIPRPTYAGKAWADLTEEEHQRMPGDYEAQVGQGPITLHSEEHLAGSDKGVTMFRHVFRQQLKAMAEGRDPLGIAFSDDEARYRILAGNFLNP